jgi:hypothetical protein
MGLILWRAPDVEAEHRLAADRRGLRYPSDLTDAEWAIVAAMIPPGRHGGRRRSVNVREVLNGSAARCTGQSNRIALQRISVDADCRLISI